MTREERATELRAIVTNSVFVEVMAELEADAFNQFMALPAHERMGAEGQSKIAHIDALRDVRDRLNWLANTSGRAPSTVV